MKRLLVSSIALAPLVTVITACINQSKPIEEINNNANDISRIKIKLDKKLNKLEIPTISREKVRLITTKLCLVSKYIKRKRKIQIM